jgi:putative OPT family oligopeptide transporter
MAEHPEHQPYIPAEQDIPEFTFSAVALGAALGILFGASSLYLVLKVGMTVSASIPVAVLAITLFRGLSGAFGLRQATILENNITQTTGSAGESIAFGVGVTMPALMLLGFEMDVGRVMVVSALGGLLGILMMIPLRRAFIVKQHGTLKYPEGTACAEVLIVGEQGGSSAKTVFAGFGIAFLYQFLWQGMKLWKDTASQGLSWFKGAAPAIEVSPALLGVGYIIGTRISCIMVAGGFLSAFVLIPAIRLFGDGLTAPLYPGVSLISAMTEDEIWSSYVLYIGAGAVAAGGIISLCQALPLIVSSIKSGLSDLRSAGRGQTATVRTDRDLPLWIVGAGSLALVGMVWATHPLHQIFDWVPDLRMNPLGAGLIVLFGFLFVTVSSRITGEIGSSSNPISGMTVATLLLTCLIFFALGWRDPSDSLTALSVAAIVCIAASNAGTTSQDLKTGYLVGANPKHQQIAILIGALSSALVIGVILILLNDAYTIHSRKAPELKAPVDVSQLPTGQAPDDTTVYRVWHALAANEQGVPPGKYFVEESGAKIAYVVDPGINGKLKRRDDGTEVPRFRAPKAQLMALITTGILQQKLPWSLVLLGVSIAIVLELAGVPSLAFAVGVYLPLSSSTPIFLGGLVRWVADRWGPYRVRPGQSETESDSSPGVLLATGYIAGGAIAGVLIGLLSFPIFEAVPRFLTQLQFRESALAQPATLEQAAEAIARTELNVPDTKSHPEHLKELITAIREQNEALQYQYVVVPAGTKLTSGKEILAVDNEQTLGAVARANFGRPGRAQLLFEDNKDALKLTLPETLPAGASLTIPQGNSAALIAFGALVAVMLCVGFGWLFKPPSAA